MRNKLLLATIESLVGSITVFTGVAIYVAIANQWPPQEIVIAASIGGLLSPLFYRTFGAGRATTIATSEPEATESQHP